MSVARKIRTVLRTARDSGHFWKRLVAEVLLQTRSTHHWSIRRPGYTLTYFPTSLSTALWLDARDQPWDEVLLAACLRPGDVVIDVGANIGTHTLAAAVATRPSGVVHAFEPHPRTFGFLGRNVARNQLTNIMLYNFAVGSQDGELHFSDCYEDTENAVMSDGPLAVPVRTLDSLDPSPGAEIAFLKIDVEGFELAVLEGARVLLGRTQAVYFEAWDRHFRGYGHSTREVIVWLAARGFTVHLCDPSARRLTAIGPEYTPATCINLLALRDVGWFVERTGYAVEVAASGLR